MISNFTQIETEEYRINPSMLIVRKDVIANGKNGQQIFDECNIVGQIVETLPPEMVGLSGRKPAACFRYRISAQQLTPAEIAEAEAKRKKEQEGKQKKMEEDAKAGAASAPPPPPGIPAPPAPKEPTYPSSTRKPGELPKA